VSMRCVINLINYYLSIYLSGYNNHLGSNNDKILTTVYSLGGWGGAVADILR